MLKAKIREDSTWHFYDDTGFHFILNWDESIKLVADAYEQYLDLYLKTFKENK